jgi:hypothetical protein
MLVGLGASLAFAGVGDIVNNFIRLGRVVGHGVLVGCKECIFLAFRSSIHHCAWHIFFCFRKKIRFKTN